jgi:putative glutamine amidotransferase
MAPAPLIGLTTSELRREAVVDPARQSDPYAHEMALGTKYARAVAAAGALPVVLPPLPGPAVGALLDRLDGVLLSGGPDLDPAAYGEREHVELGPTEPALDTFELAVAAHADRRGLPMLAVCRGAQVVNVARGGSLHQHLPAVVGEQIAHRQTADSTRATHRVRVAPDSRLRELVRRGTLDVNSFHHQAAARVGHGLRPVAWADDGTIEALEALDRPFLLAVQWHAEGLAHRCEHAALFEALAAAAARFADAGGQALKRAA